MLCQPEAEASAPPGRGLETTDAVAPCKPLSPPRRLDSQLVVAPAGRTARASTPTPGHPARVALQRGLEAPKWQLGWLPALRSAMQGRKQFPERLKEWNTPQAWKQPWESLQKSEGFCRRQDNLAMNSMTDPGPGPQAVGKAELPQSRREGRYFWESLNKFAGDGEAIGRPTAACPIRQQACGTIHKTCSRGTSPTTVRPRTPTPWCRTSPGATSSVK